ncbi:MULTISPECIES: hypothetical protein [Streptomyces]|uniref:Uncharacterized protein n=2 Tax=Streptomyces TaxID=1883 RepID=A0A652KU24_9ACTN|nr:MULTISPECIES: hypothetical protein [unclassified Streptomyces]WSS63946.1 hypothetical protein OG284_23265 [Streptomyces sp. NBC_01177]WSS70939.1 hypothetical protein OG491_22870 [Streptomyces sp. NBC_01175]MDX3325089.1 hypothetical protein [Streptomyces sp. ME02-6979-3A]MDX3431709.1 hypothetical protein [Streptomyces sp. ME01-18a]TXS27141.1 hypothetical protein EAO74_13875 [Streptomyces sp. gb1(2016)]
MSGGGGWGDRSTGHIPPSAPGGGWFFPLSRSWAAGALVYVFGGYLMARALVETLATDERLELFGWRLALLHLPGVLVTVLTVLAAARTLPARHRDSRLLYLLGSLAVPVAGLAYGYAVAWDVVGAEGLVMPAVAMVTGAAVGLALDRLIEDRDEGTANPSAYTRSYDWRDGGATATEYLGVIVLVVALIGALALAGLGGRIGDGIRCAISSLTGEGGGCAAGGDGTAKPKTDADYEPKLCQISNVSDTAGGKVKIGWFEWGEEYGFQQKVSQANTDVNGDGKVDENDKLVHMTFTDAASAGVNASTPGVKLGSLGKADVDIGGGIKITNGDTWVFKSEAEAQKMRDDIEEMKMWETSMKHSGGYGGGWYSGMKWAEKKEDIEKKIGDKKISYSTVGINVYADGGLSIKAGDEDKLGAKLGGKAKFSPDVTITKDDVNGNESYTYTAKLEIEGKVGGNAGPLGGTAGAKDSRTGALTVTRDQKTGKIVRIDMTKTVEKTSTSDKGEVGGDNGQKGSDKRGGKGGITDSSGDTGIEVQTNSIVFGKETDKVTEAKRSLAEEWLDGSGDNTAPFAYMFGDHSLEAKPAGTDAFDQLMYQDGLSSTMRYHGETDAQEFGFEVSLGMSLGLSISDEHKKETLTDAQFLGAPQGDKRTYLPYSYCAQ